MRKEGVKLIFDREAPSGRGTSRSSSSSSSSGSSYSSSRGSRSSRRSRTSSRSSSSDSSSSSRSRSRSRPRCSGRSHCRHIHRSPPRRYRARSRSYSPSPKGSSHYSRYHRRSRSPSPYSYSRRYRRSPSRSRSRSPVYWRGNRYVGRYRCRFSRSPRSPRSYRSRSRSHERSIRLSLEEKKYLLNVAKANAAQILGVQNLELPESLKEMEQQEEERKRRSSSDKEERVRVDPAPQKTSAQVNGVDDEEAETSQTSPKRKPIVFSNNNAVAKPSNSPTLSDSKVTSRADSVADRRPYGQWVPIGKSFSKKKH